MPSSLPVVGVRAPRFTARWGTLTFLIPLLQPRLLNALLSEPSTVPKSPQPVVLQWRIGFAAYVVLASSAPSLDRWHALSGALSRG